MRSVSDEVERCLLSFLRLCIEHVLASGEQIDTSAEVVARSFHQQMTIDVDTSLHDHFEATLDQLVTLVSAIAPRVPAATITDFVSKTSPARVAETLERSLMGALKAGRA